MFHNSTNINKTNNHFSHQLIEHKTDHDRHWLRPGTKMWWG